MSQSEEPNPQTLQVVPPVFRFTPAEQDVSDKIVAAWDALVALPDHAGHDLEDFARCFRRIQQILAMRQCRRTDPDMYPTHATLHDPKQAY